MVLTCGTSKRSITPPPGLEPLYLAGYHSPDPNDPSIFAPVITGIKDDIHVRAMVLSDGTEKVALASVEVIGLLGDFIYEVKIPLEAWGFKKRNVFIFSTHTHAAPDMMGLWGNQLGISGENRKYRYFVMDAIISAIMEADQSMVPVDVFWGHGSRADLVENYRKAGNVDGAIHALVFKYHETGRDAPSINIAGILWSFTAQPEITTRENTMISPDYPGLVSSMIERDNDCVALFGLGACGTQSPVFCEQGQDKLNLFTKNLAGSLSTIITEATEIPGDKIETRSRTIQLPIQNEGFSLLFKAGIFNKDMLIGERIITTVAKLRLGPVDILHVPGEPFPEIVRKVLASNDMEEQQVMIISQSNDALGYFIPLDQFTCKATKWQNLGEKTRFTGHEDESLGPESTRIVEQAMKDLFRYKTVLAIGAHADDLTIWAGGTLKDLSREGNEVICVRVCDDWEDCVGVSREDAIERNRREADEAYRLLGASKTIHLGYPSDYLAGADYLELRGKIVLLIRKYKPELIISFDLNGIDEENQDHVIVARAVNEACWQASFDALYPEHFEQGLAIHTVGQRYLFARNPTVANHAVDITDFIEDKINAICMHSTVLKNFFHQYTLLARANHLKINLLEKSFPDIVKVNLLVRLVYGEIGKKFGIKYAEIFNKIGAGLLEDLASSD